MSYLDIINEKINILKLYYYQKNESNNEEYLKYKQLLNFYFKSEQKQQLYKKEFKDGKIILSNPKKTIKITPSKFVDMNKLYIELKSANDNILFKITSMVDNRNNINEQLRLDFEELKNKYLLYK